MLAAVKKLCVPGAKIVEICEKGDQLIEEEVSKVYRGKKVNKGSFVALKILAPYASMPWRLSELVY